MTTHPRSFIDESIFAQVVFFFEHDEAVPIDDWLFWATQANNPFGSSSRGASFKDLFFRWCVVGDDDDDDWLWRRSAWLVSSAAITGYTQKQSSPPVLWQGIKQECHLNFNPIHPKTSLYGCSECLFVIATLESPCWILARSDIRKHSLTWSIAHSQSVSPTSLPYLNSLNREKKPFMCVRSMIT